jgi:RND family efflux transporter MFP subunit
MNPQVDLRQLAVRREESSAAARPAPRRHLVSRYLLPAVVLLGFAVVVAWAARDSLLPSQPVTVVPVLATRGEVQPSGAPLFQAAGWVEPRPTPTLVSALAEGLVEKLLVVEGQEVKAGQAIAQLIDTDARLGVAAARADLELREAEVVAARAALEAARTSLAHPVQLDAALAEAGAMLARVETELSNLTFQQQAAEARRQLAEVEYRNKLAASASVPALTIERARSELATAVATVEELKHRRPRLEQEARALTAKRDALSRQRELLIEEKRRRDEGEANLKAAEARRDQARVALQTAELRLERMTVKAPTAGRVLNLVARPGTRLMGLAPASHQEASTVISMYDPASLQVRADVRLEDVPRVQPGQPVRIETPAAPGGPLEGEVLFATAITDIQKNTLQVKVTIRHPPPTLKPDMLVQVTFLAPPSPANSSHPADELRLLVPRQLVDSGDKGAWVWVADQVHGSARRRAVKLGPVHGTDLVEVVEGLTPADKLIVGGREGLADGQRITVLGEDATLGTTRHDAGRRPSRLSRLPGAPPNREPKP